MITQKSRLLVISLMMLFLVFGLYVPIATENTHVVSINDQVSVDLSREGSVTGPSRSDDLRWPWIPETDELEPAETHPDGFQMNLLDKDWPFGDTNDAGAETVAPTMEGRWFPKLSYSSLTFEISFSSSETNGVYIYAWVARDQDTISRYLKFYFDDNYITQYVIGSSGFKGMVSVPQDKIALTSTHTVTLTINYGGYVDRGWKLLYVGVGEYEGGQYLPLTVSTEALPRPLNEMTPATGQTDCTMEYDVIVGESTYLELTMTKGVDTTSRSVYVYFETSPGSYSLERIFSVGSSPVSISEPLGTYTDDSHRKIKFVIKGVGNTHKAKKITRLSVNHIACYLEIDYMTCDSCWTTSKIAQRIDEMNDLWLETHSYHRVYYQIDDNVGHMDDVYIGTWVGMNWQWFDHAPYPGWEWVLFAHSLQAGSSNPQGWHSVLYGFDYGIAVSGESSSYWQTLGHEYGHHIGILDYWFGEVYCENHKCIMSNYIGPYYYCLHHWLQRNRV